MSRTRPRVVLGSMLLTLALVAAPAAAQAPPPAGTLSESELIDGLRRGGYVIYFRHATSNPEQADTSDPKLGQCATQRNLSAEGRQMARDIGVAFRTLHIPVGKVVSSPYCRTIDTATLAFTRPEISEALYFSMGVGKTERDQQSQALRQMLAATPARGTNTVLVAHHANLKEATGIWPKREGDAHVFRPRADGGFDYVGEVTPTAWSRRAGIARPTPVSGERN